MKLAIERLQQPFLSQQEIASSFDIMGLDTQLIDDATYYVVEVDDRVAGCGGWSKRATLYGGDHSRTRDSALLDPTKDAARIRAMYTHPDNVRQGIGRLVLETCEDAARSAGFSRAELVATLSGEPLYKACGYAVVEEMSADTKSGVPIPVRLMRKKLI